MDQLSNRGSVEDIKCSLKLMEAKTIKDKAVDISYLQSCLQYETRNKKRSSVISAIQATINRLQKLNP